MLDRQMSMISLAQKAGKVLSGEFSVEKGLKEGDVVLCIVATDASDNTKKKFKNMCTYRSIDMLELADKEQLGRTIGKQQRATLGITDEGFKKGILKHHRGETMNDS